MGIMEFVQLDEVRYRDFVMAQDRCFFTQLPAYAQARMREGFTVAHVGLVESGVIKAAATLLYQPWKKMFSRILIPYGPVLDWNDMALVRTFFDQLIAWAKQDKKVLSIRVNPLLIRRPYDDVEPGEETPQARLFDEAMAQIGAQRVAREFYDSPDIQMRFAYVKDLAGMSFKDVVSSVDQVVRTRFNKMGTNGVDVEFLSPDRIDILEKVLHHTASRTEMHDIEHASIAYYRDLMERMGPGGVFIPAAILHCHKAIALFDAEIAEVTAKLDQLAQAEEKAREAGKELGKKHRNQVKLFRTRLDVAERRKNETLAVQRDNGDDVVLAASLFIHSPHELVYLVSGAYSQFQSYYGVYFIHYVMMKWAVEHDVRWYNMFGITGDFSDDASDAGVLHFKRQFRGHVEEYVGTYDVPLRKRLAPQLGAIG
jgi:peptidoglycan pentaglycine glycine transferase (the second and third glycine)/peptidoglycan pentaglycine glycine transferase (the fourth and fifth glycine)